MIAIVVPFAGLLAVLLVAEQGDPPAHRKAGGDGSAAAMMPGRKTPGRETSGVEIPRAIQAEVEADRLDVFDRPEDRGFITGQVCRGDRLRVRPDRVPGTGWLAVEPSATTICWIEQSSLELEEAEAPDGTGQGDHQAGRDRSRMERAWVSRPRAVIRSGHPQALLPGPPRGELPKGTMVQLVDRPALSLGRGRGPTKTRWLAIVPPPDQVFFVHADGVRWLSPTMTPPVPPAAEVRASFEEPIALDQSGTPSRGKPASPPSSWPAEISAELERIDATYKAIIASQPIDRWRFETVRADYQGLLKRAGDRLDLEDALRTRLARVTQHEQASRAARTIESILSMSHRRDREVATVRRDLARLEQTRARAYDAVGFIQPSVRKVDGHKVFALIGAQGSAIAYLDIPAGLDPEPYLARRVGVRGQAHFSEDLGTRLITVRDLENVEARK